MEKYKLKDFAQWAQQEKISDDQLLLVLAEMSSGLLGDRLGSNIYKKRVSVRGRGKRGGARVILVFKSEALAVFLYGYMKNEQDNISENEERQLRLFSKVFCQLSSEKRAQLCNQGKLFQL